MKNQMAMTKLNRLKELLLLILVISSSISFAIEKGEIVSNKQGVSDSIVNEVIRIDRDRIIKRADHLLNEAPEQ